MGCAHSREALGAALLQASEDPNANVENEATTSPAAASSRRRKSVNHLHRAFAYTSSGSGSSTHRDVFSIFAEQGMALEHLDNHGLASPPSCQLMCSPCSMSAASLFSNATTTASDSEDRTHVPGPLDRFIPSLNIAYGVCSDKGVRKLNEDRMVCTAHIVRDDECIAYFGIYDGHNGSTVANYLAENLHDAVFEHFELHGEWTSSIEQAFAATDAQIFQDEVVGGSTAITAVIHDREVVVACVGDSRAVICGQNGAVRLVSSAHTPDVPEEHARIVAAKGIVAQGRVFGLLSVSRSFGDNDFKTSRGEYSKQFEGDLVSAEPEVMRLTLTPEDEFIILGSDGLFDVMSSQQVVDFVRVKMTQHGNVQHASEELVSYAISMGSTDNVTAIVVALNPTSHCCGPVAGDDE